MATRGKTIFYRLFVLFGLLPICINSFAQLPKLDPEKWAIELDKKGFAGNQEFNKLDSLLESRSGGSIVSGNIPRPALIDSSKAFQFLGELAEKGKSKGYHFWARLNALKAKQSYFQIVVAKKPTSSLSGIREEVKKILSDAIDLAYRSEDEHLIASVSLHYGKTIYQVGELGLAVMYTMNGIQLFEKLSYNIKPPDYQFLGETLYRVREYNDCIKYAQKAVTAWKNSPDEFKPFTVSCINTVALGYHRQHLYDSALIFYEQALQLAEKENIPVWVGIVSGNIAQIYFEQKKYDTAYAIFKSDYRTSRDSGFYDNAANSLQWAARTNLAMGNKAIALKEVKEAAELLKLWPDAGYLRNTYYTTTQAFRQLGNYDSAFYYNNLYSMLNDSLEKIVSTSSMEISKARLNDETSRYNIQKLNREKRSQLQFRNFVIALIILVSMIALLYVNRLRVRHIYKERLALQEKNAAETHAREQLQLVTQNLIEKTGLVDELQRQVNGTTVSVERQQLVTTISNLTILTEADWEKFKSIFEQLYPAFFLNLQEKVTDITVAEMRMAALTRLGLSTNQIASMLGISTNSVYKTRQRLRQRLNLDTEASIEEVIAKV